MQLYQTSKHLLYNYIIIYLSASIMWYMLGMNEQV